jgi:pimeloyl-ACP methyl ester carboxylesterase
MAQQAKALIGWCATKDPENRVLRSIEQPVLVVSGSNDTMLPDSNAYLMFKHLKNAQLILYPDAGHGALFQYPARFVSHAALFLAE